MKTPSELFEEFWREYNKTKYENQAKHCRDSFLAGFAACEAEQAKRCCESCKWSRPYGNLICEYLEDNISGSGSLCIAKDFSCCKWQPKDEV